MRDINGRGGSRLALMAKIGYNRFPSIRECAAHGRPNAHTSVFLHLRLLIRILYPLHYDDNQCVNIHWENIATTSHHNRSELVHCGENGQMSLPVARDRQDKLKMTPQNSRSSEETYGAELHVRPVEHMCARDLHARLSRRREQRWEAGDRMLRNLARQDAGR